MPKAISVMFTLVVDNESKRLLQEVEILYEDGILISMKVEANKPLRLDFDHLYRARSALDSDDG